MPDDENDNASTSDASTASGAGNMQGTAAAGSPESDVLSFADELGIVDCKDPVLGGRGRVFLSAGPLSPVAEFTNDFVVLHPPQKPFTDADDGPAEEIVLQMDRTGVLVNELGERKKIPGARFHGREIFHFCEQKPGTLKHFAVYFDEEGNHHYLSISGERITTDVIYKLRNMTHDGELTKFSEITGE